MTFNKKQTCHYEGPVRGGGSRDSYIPGIDGEFVARQTAMHWVLQEEAEIIFKHCNSTRNIKSVFTKSVAKYLLSN